MVLIVEDHQSTRRFLADNLAADGYEPIEAGTAAEAHRQMQTRLPELVIVDLGLPDLDGLELLQAVRGSDRAAGQLDPDLPCWCSPAACGELDRLRAFERGADDYLSSPSATGAPRPAGRPPAPCSGAAGLGRMRVGALELDPMSRQVWVRGEAVRAHQQGVRAGAARWPPSRRGCSRARNCSPSVWGFQAVGATRTLDSHASRLRRKLSCGRQRFVVNVWGVGYCLVQGSSVHGDGF